MAQRTTPVPKIVTWTSSGTASDALYIGNASVFGIEMPATFTGTTLAIHGCSTSGGTFRLLSLPGVANPFTVAAGGGYSIDPLLTAGWPWIKLVSGSSEAAGRTANAMCRVF